MGAAPVVTEELLERALVSALRRPHPGTLATIGDAAPSCRFSASRRVDDRESLRRYGNESHVRRYGDMHP
jgi:hypothetical protein